jgi:hypothetical protein
MELRVNRVPKALLDHRDTRALQELQELLGLLGLLELLELLDQLDDKGRLGQLGGKETLAVKVRGDHPDLLVYQVTRVSLAPRDLPEHPVAMVLLDRHIKNSVDAAAVMAVEDVYTVDQSAIRQAMLLSTFFRLEVDADALRITKAMLVVINT